MKGTWITILALAANFNAFAQGQVNFNTHVTSANPPVDARIFSFPEGTPWTAGFGELAIVSGNGSTAIYTPLTPIGAFGTSAADAGYINAGTATAPPGFPGGTVVYMVLRTWLGNAGSTFDSSSWKGQSAPITITLTEPPNKPNDLVGLQGFALVPEPTTAALGVIGIATFLLRGRRSRFMNS